MSIIEKSNPLNLQYRVCIVTSAASPLGVIICKTLLKANALVLGLDTNVKHASLNAGLGTHFQFEQCDLQDSQTPERALKAAREAFGTDRVDVLVNVLDGGALKGYENLSQAVGDLMREERRGSIVNVLAQGTESRDSQPSIEFSKARAAQHRKENIRCSIVIPQASGDGAQQEASKEAYEVAKTHMTALIKTEKITKDLESAAESKQAAANLYDIGNVTLFLAGDMGEGITGAKVYLDGSHQEL